jgi:hypothetical protein
VILELMRFFLERILTRPGIGVKTLHIKISDETRERIVHILENNLQSRSDVAKSFSLPYSTACDII